MYGEGRGHSCREAVMPLPAMMILVVHNDPDGRVNV